MKVRTSPEWLNASDAARVLGVTRQNIRVLAARNLISTKSLPGIRSLYRRQDLEQLERVYVRPAVSMAR